MSTRREDQPAERDKEIAERVRVIMARENVSQAELSRLTSIPATSLGPYLKGERRWPAVALDDVAWALGVHACDLLEEERRHPSGVEGQMIRSQPGRVVELFRAGSQQTSAAEREFLEAVAAAADRLRTRLTEEEQGS